MSLRRPSSDEPMLPDWGHSTLAEVLPSIGAHLGVRDAGVPALDLPPSHRWVVVMVDGLGHDLLRQHMAIAPYFADLFGDGQEITATVPSTTATSLTSLGSGTAPGRHGIVGYSFRDQAGGKVFNALTWDTEAVPEEIQPGPTWFEKACSCEATCTGVVPERFRDSGLTRAALRGQVVSGLVDEADEQDRIDRVVAASRDGRRSLVYVYERMLDHTGHTLGIQHPAWRQQLTRIDDWVARLRGALDDDVVLLATGDHGMLDIPLDRRILVQDHPELMRGVTALAGEGRFRQLYADHPADVAARWTDFLGERAWVRTREQAIEQSWFGPNVTPQAAQRIGDVVAAMRDDWAVMSKDLPRELALVGMHGSLTPAEMVVPLLVDAPEHY